MTSHWNVQIHIQEVREPELQKDSSGREIRGPIGPVLTERKVIERLHISVVADSEPEALLKVERVLKTEMPVPVRESYEVTTESGAAAIFMPRAE